MPTKNIESGVVQERPLKIDLNIFDERKFLARTYIRLSEAGIILGNAQSIHEKM